MTDQRLFAEVQRVLEALGDTPTEDLEARIRVLTGDDEALRHAVHGCLDTDDQLDDVSAIVAAAARRVVTEEDPLIGALLGAYRVTERIGEGGMSVVYLAVRADDAFERAVVLKLMKRGLDTDALLRRFETERRILANLDHPHIARLYDAASTEDGRPYFVMEHVDGIPLDAFAREGGLPVRRTLRLFLAVCDAVGYAHQRLVVHRDLKPANILVTGDGTPKLLDFGIAKLLGDGDPGIPQATTDLLTPDYASPEQIRGDAISTATDQYSLGVLLYLLLSGERPYEARARTREGLLASVLGARPSAPSRVRRGVPRDLDFIVEKAMRSEPDERYGSIRELADDVLRHLEGRPVIARRGTLRYRAAKFIRRNRMPLTVGLVLATLAIVLGVQSLRLARLRVRSETVARQLAGMAVVADSDISFVEAPSNPALELGRESFTLSAWIRMTGSAEEPLIIMDKRVPPYHFSRGFVLFTFANRLGLQMADGVRMHTSGGGSRVETTGSTNYVAYRDLVDARWHHVVASVYRDTTDATANRIELYVDGHLDRAFRAEVVRAGDISCDAPLRIGLESDGFHIARPFTGSIRHPRIFARAMEAEEVARRHRSERAALSPGSLHVPSWVRGSSDSVRIPLVVTNGGPHPLAYTWTIAGLPDENGHAPVSRFAPASGHVVLSPGPSSARIPIVAILDRERLREVGYGSYRVAVVHSESSEPISQEGRVLADGYEGDIPADRPPPPLRPDVTPQLDSGIPLVFESRVRANTFITDPTLSFDVGDDPIPVVLEVVALSGNVVRRIDLGVVPTGQHSIAWDGRDDDRRPVPGGHYTMDVRGQRRRTQWDAKTGEWSWPVVSGRFASRVVYVPPRPASGAEPSGTP